MVYYLILTCKVNCVLGGYLVLGNTLCKSLIKFMKSFNVDSLWDFTSPIKGSLNPLINNKTNLAIDT